jgi:hypothetical protein
MEMWHRWTASVCVNLPAIELRPRDGLHPDHYVHLDLILCLKSRIRT